MRGQGLLPVRLEGVRTPSIASPDKLRLCRSERDAALASITISGLTYAEIGARCGVSKQAVEKWTRKGVPHARVRAFCNATGTRLVEQYIALERALRAAEGHIRERDYIDAIASAA